MYLVDTNVLSEARRGSREARIWFRSVEPTTIYLSVITLGEVMKVIRAQTANRSPCSCGLMCGWNGCGSIPVTESCRSAAP